MPPLLNEIYTALRLFPVVVTPDETPTVLLVRPGHPGAVGTTTADPAVLVPSALPLPVLPGELPVVSRPAPPGVFLGGSLVPLG